MKLRPAALARAPQIAALALLAATAGCATDSGPPLVLDFGARVCTDKPDLARAANVAYTPDDPKTVTIDLDSTAPCLRNPDGTSSVYALFALPESAEPRILSLASVQVRSTIFPPSSELLDGSGASSRTVPSSAFFFRGGSGLEAQLRTHPGEKYVLVKSIPELVGKSLARTMATTSVYSGGSPYYFQIHSGSDVTTTLTYALSGKLAVILKPLPSPKPAAH